MLAFGPAEFFLLTILGLVAIAVSARGKLLRGLIAGGFGLMLAFVGSDTVSGELRFTLDIDYLWDGIPLVPTLTGMFARQPDDRAGAEGRIGGGQPWTRRREDAISGVWDGVKAVFVNWPVTAARVGDRYDHRGDPGAGRDGGVVSGLYLDRADVARSPGRFGKGNILGVIAPESANNAKDGGSLVPTVAFGIPGSAETALFLGILVLHGIDPGPSILLDNQREVYGLIVALTLSAVGASVIGLIFARWLVLITHVNVHFLVPVVVAVSLTGVYVLDGKPGDVVLAMIMGIVGYLMIRFDYPRLTLVIALVLGETAERSFHQTRDDFGQ